MHNPVKEILAAATAVVAAGMSPEEHREVRDFLKLLKQQVALMDEGHAFELAWVLEHYNGLKARADKAAEVR